MGTCEWSGEVVMDDPPTGILSGTFKANATMAGCLLDLSGGTMYKNALLTDGAYDVTLRNGILHPSNDGWMFHVYGTGALILDSDAAMTNNLPFVKNGDGRLEIHGALGTQKPFILHRGTVAVGHSDSLGMTGGTWNSGDPDWQRESDEASIVRVQGDATLEALADGLDIHRDIWLGDGNQKRTLTLTVDIPADMTLTLSGKIIDYGGIRKTGEGTLVLAGTASTYFGGTEFAEGTVSVSSMKALGHSSCQPKRFSGGVLQITGMDCDTMDSVYVDNWGAFDGGFDIDGKNNTFTIGSPVTVKALGAFITAGAGMLALEGGITLGAGTTLRVVGGAAGNGGILVDTLDLSQATLEVVAGKDVNEVTIATVAGNYTPSANVKLPAGFALKYRNGKVVAKKDGGTLILVR